MCGGSRRWRWRLEAGVSPVRVSMRIGRPISATGRFEVARDVDRQRLERRDVERVQTAFAADVAAGGDELARRPRLQSILCAPFFACALSSTRLGKNPASVLPAPVGAISSTERPARAFARSSS